MPRGSAGHVVGHGLIESKHPQVRWNAPISQMGRQRPREAR